MFYYWSDALVKKMAPKNEVLIQIVAFLFKHQGFSGENLWAQTLNYLGVC